MFALGIEHIVSGYDHLLFLGALLLVCGSFGSMARTVTAFTVAHSITLAAATLGGFALPSSWVEPAIAASIVYAAGTNALTRGEGERLGLTFAFGLVHGLGFAGLLAELGVGGDGPGQILVPLLLFNLGVEAGQIAIAAAVLPLLLVLRRRAAFRVRGAPALSAGIAGLGLFWLLERTLLV